MERVKLGEFCWTDLQSVDVDGQSAFYESLFGWTHQDLPTGPTTPDYRMFFKDGVIAAGCNTMSPDMAGMPSFWAVYIATPDVDATVAKAEALGATVIMPTMDVLDSGRMVAIADPTGGSVFLWQARAHKGAEIFMSEGAISWADLSTRDPETAAAFYAELLGWEIVKTETPGPYWQVLIDGEAQGGIMLMPEMMGPDVPAFWTIYFGTNDMDASLGQVAALGGTVIAPPMEIGDGVSFAVVSDPAGAVFSLLGPLDT